MRSRFSDWELSKSYHWKLTTKEITAKRRVFQISMHYRLQQLGYYNYYTQEIPDSEMGTILHSRESVSLGIALLLQSNVTISHLKEFGSKVNYNILREIVNESVTGRNGVLS
jgi:hypothetical protein